MSELQESSEVVVPSKALSPLTAKLNGLKHDRPFDRLPDRIQQWCRLVAEGQSAMGACALVTGKTRPTGLSSRWMVRYGHHVARLRQEVLEKRVANVREVLEGVTELARQRDDLKVATANLHKLGEWQGLGAVKGETLSERQVVRLLMAALGFAQSNDVVDAEVVNEE